MTNEECFDCMWQGAKFIACEKHVISLLPGSCLAEKAIKLWSTHYFNLIEFAKKTDALCSHHFKDEVYWVNYDDGSYITIGKNIVTYGGKGSGLSEESLSKYYQRIYIR